jgi:hypothetical protein
VLQNLVEVEGFPNLDVSELVPILRDDDFVSPNGDLICTTIFEWFAWHYKNRLTHVTKVMKVLRIPPSEEFLSEIKQKKEGI